MEIPEHLKKLYAHWGKHARQQLLHSTNPNVDTETYRKVLAFAEKRMYVWGAKTRNEERPYSDDIVLNTYRFCNIYRELDRQTIEFHTLLKPLVHNKVLWIANMFFCRLIANTETIHAIGLLSLNEAHNRKMCDALRILPSPKYGTPYVFPISAIQKSPYPTREDFFCVYIPSIAEKLAQEIENMEDVSVAEAVPVLCKALGFNLKFHITELLIDVAYQYPEHIDLYKPFQTGPGSWITISKLVPHSETSIACAILAQIQTPTFPLLTYNGAHIPLSAENWEGIGCEYRKYIHLSKGIGRKRIYRTR